METSKAGILRSLDADYNSLYTAKRAAVDDLVSAIHADEKDAIMQSKEKVIKLQKQEVQLRDSVKTTIGSAIPNAKTSAPVL